MLIVIELLNLVLIVAIFAVILWLRVGLNRNIGKATDPVEQSLERVRVALEEKLSATTADTATRLEKTKGDLRQEITDRLDRAFHGIREAVERQLTDGRAEQASTIRNAVQGLEMKFANLQSATESELRKSRSNADSQLREMRIEQNDRLDKTARALQSEVNNLTILTRKSLDEVRAQLDTKLFEISQQVTEKLDENSGKLNESSIQMRKELADSLKGSSDTQRLEFAGLTQQTREGLDKIRVEVDAKLAAITGQVTDKLDKNIREGVQQFEKVQQHLRAAEEELRNVGLLGNSVHELNNLLRLPHLRGRFGEASLERLLADFLPAHMYELQGAAGENGSGRADALIKFPERTLPIDAKFPREQIAALFESVDAAELNSARENFARVMKEQGRRIAGYIRPENGTTDMALMYLPSETLYMEIVINGDLSEWLNKKKIFPVSPNTLIVTLQSIQMVFQMYEFAKGYERATLELKKAQAVFSNFENQFEDIGKSLTKAQRSYEVASGHLSKYRNRLANLSVEDEPDLAALGK